MSFLGLLFTLINKITMCSFLVLCLLLAIYFLPVWVLKHIKHWQPSLSYSGFSWVDCNSSRNSWRDVDGSTVVWILCFFVAGFQRIFQSLESASNFIRSLLPEIISNKVSVPVFLVWVENSTFEAFCFLPENEIAKLTHECCRGGKEEGSWSWLPSFGRLAWGSEVLSKGINNGSLLRQYTVE